MKRPIVLITVFLLLFCSYSYSQSLDSLAIIISSDHVLERKVDKLDSLVLQADSLEYDSLAWLYRQYAYWMFEYDLTKTFELTYLAENIAHATVRKDSTLLYKIKIDLGYYYLSEFEYSKGIGKFKEALEWTDSNGEASKAYEYIAICYEALKDYFRALENYKIAEGLLENKEDLVRRQMILNYNISIALAKQNTKEALLISRYYAHKADSICTASPELEPYRIEVKFNHAEVYNNDLDLDTFRSSQLYEEVYNLAIEQKDTSAIIRTYYGRGGLFNGTNQKKSKHFHYKALSLIDDLDSISRHENLYGLGKAFAYEGKYSESIQSLIKSLQFLTGQDFSDPKALLEQEADFYENADYLIYNLPLLGEVYLRWYEKTKNKTFLDKSLAYFRFTDKMIDYQKLNSKDFLSRLFWRKESTGLYGKALRVCYLLEDYDEALYFMEKNKALLLMEDISQKELKKSLNKYPQYFQREKSLKQNIFSVASQLSDASEPSSVLDLQKQKMDLEINLSLLQDSIYGLKKVLKYDPAQLKIIDVQETLKEDEVFIEYHVSIDNGYGIYSNNEKGFVLIISKNSCQLLEIEQLDELYADIKKLTTYIKVPFDSQSDIDNYNQLSNKLFLTLFPNEETRYFLENKKLILSLDYYLNFLPFEALSTSPDQSDFFIKKTEISYVYSFTFGENNMLETQPTTNSIVAFAPQVFEDQNLFPLAYTENEIDAIKKSISGKYYLKSDAIKKRFIDESSKHGIIHLATHAYSSVDSTPWISFYDEKMTLDELYLIENNASLVVLSACKTNIGKLAVGEGVMSLARGFFYGGTQSVVSTLWNVDDKSTSIILDQFYSNLKKGEDKSSALHNAKLKYLAGNSHSELSPYYWSSFVLLGDTTPLKIRDSIFSNPMFIFFFVVITLIIIVLIKLFEKR